MVRTYKFPIVLNELLAINDITQTRLAEDLSIANVTVCNWINKKSHPSVPELIKVANYFHVATDYLLFGQN